MGAAELDDLDTGPGAVVIGPNDGHAGLPENEVAADDRDFAFGSVENFRTPGLFARDDDGMGIDPLKLAIANDGERRFLYGGANDRLPIFAKIVEPNDSPSVAVAVIGDLHRPSVMEETVVGLSRTGKHEARSYANRNSGGNQPIWGLTVLHRFYSIR